MKRFLYLLLLSMSACATKAPTQPFAPMSSYEYFHSWYNGSNLHSVWGLGELEAGIEEGYVLCGEERVGVRSIFEPHLQASVEPEKGRTAEEANARNLNVVARFAKSGITCRLPDIDAPAHSQ